MNKKLIHNIGIMLAIMVLMSCTSNRFKLPPLKETFSQLDKNPFGTYVLHNQLEQLYYNNTVRTVKDKFEITWQKISDTNSLYINVSKNLFLAKKDLEGMLEYVYNGNTLFISSDHIDRRLLDTLGCTVSKPFYDQLIREMKYTSVKMAAEIYGDSLAYEYFYVPFYNHFTKLDKQHSRVLGLNKSGNNFIVVFYGKGRFYLHLEPRALSNYFLLQKDNYKYFQHVFSLTPAVPEHIYWDDYYNKKNYQRVAGNKSGLAVLLRYPAMAWAFWLLAALFAAYVFFGGKRRQRIVKAIPPNTNTTIAFTETIGRLYLQKKDNHNIADKLITYFLEFIRNRYYLNTSHIDDAFITTLSRKSNNTKEGTHKLFTFINTLQQSTEVADEQMLSLNQQIEHFHKNQL